MINTSWYQKSIAECIDKLATNSSKGLALSEVSKRQAESKNILEQGSRISPVKIFLNQFTDTMVLVLLAATVISGIIGDIADAITIMAIVVINAILGFVQEYRAERSLDEIKKLGSPHAIVLRAGIKSKILAEDLVPGDIVFIEAGDKVPADLRLIDTFSLAIDEAILTGESVPVEKDGTVVYKHEVPIAEQRNFAFMGTAVTRGRGVALVVHTGMETVMGQIAELMKKTEESLTPLQIKLDQLGKILIVICLIVCTIVAVMGILRGESVLTMLMAGISLAVAAIPEGLPAIVTIVLALGVQRMAKSNTIIRKLPAVETLGCTTVICSDKTGTLTQNKMTVKRIASLDLMAYIEGTRYSLMGKNKTVNIMKDKALSLTIKNAFHCNNAVLNDKGENQGDPTELALLVMAKKVGQKLEYKRIREIPFDSTRKKMTVVVEAKGEYFVFTKGALDMLIDSCESIIKNNQVNKLNGMDKENLFKIQEGWANDALRVLGFAFRQLSRQDALNLPDSLLESSLTLTGLCGMIDPPREGVEQSVKECIKAGIVPVMITGDHPTTARAIANTIGITDQAKVITGMEIDIMSDQELYKGALANRVFARVTPQHKNRIVNVLKAKNHVVAMTGDGVNDAPAVKSADIGIAMGITGTEVTKEVSAMVLVDDDFSTIIKAVYEGRAIYDNIRKFIRYLLGCNVGEILVMFLASLFGMPLPLLPIQILWVNLVTDGLPAMALGLEPPEPGIMDRKPRPKKESIFARRLGWIILGRGLYIGVITLVVFTIGLIYAQINGIYDLNIPRTMALTTLVFCQLFYVFECRSEKHSSFELGFFSNPFLLVAITVSIIMQLAVIYLPLFQNVFHTVPLDAWQWAIILTVAGGKLIYKNIYALIRSIFI
ncbi:MAG TPA: calcium-translocating P-type ATPase, SERCA-type [Syntrophomonadaceae bacterium]|nr:calcium-translocating P-type ATPase, SERCA-type [Syntrophomonadaceae bacterium]